MAEKNGIEHKNNKEADEVNLLVDLPSSLNHFFTGGLFILAILAALYFAYAIIIPILLAFILKLALLPVIRFFEKLKCPRSLAAILVIASLFAVFIGFGTILYKPAINWAEKLPTGIPKLQQRLTFLSKPVDTLQNLLIRAENVTVVGHNTKVVQVAIAGSRLSDRFLHSTRELLGGLSTTLLLLFFLINSGDTFLRRLVEILPRFQDKRQAVDISQQIEKDITAYILTITFMNLFIGILMASIMAIFNIGDPILWGAIAFILNYIPIIGPLVGIIMFLLAGLLDQAILSAAILPASLYFLFHVIESNILTPKMLARRFTLNPVLLILSLIFWFWMWGIPGAILAMPILTIIKIICDRVEKLAPIGHFMEA